MKKLNFSFTNKLRPKKGSVLISDPFLNDPYFGRSVIVLCEHNKKGTFGFVLNNFLDIDLHKIDSNFPNINARIGFGGPVSKDSLFFIHSFGEKVKDSLKIQKELYYGGDFDAVCKILKEKPPFQIVHYPKLFSTHKTFPCLPILTVLLKQCNII